MARKDWSCWEITRCGSEATCFARQRAGEAKPCWEVARELNDYRSAMNVCQDCIVYISKARSRSLSEQEVEEILARKIECVLAAGCPNR
ncbi:MAG: hypothetical protein ACOY3Z_11605 [Thermodesulfobacteriota bacterium]